MRRIAAGIVAAGILILPTAGIVNAAEKDPDVAAWVKANKSVIEFALNVNVDECAGLDDLEYSAAVDFAKAQDIDLDELISKADGKNPTDLLKHLDAEGITVGDLRAMVQGFCDGDIQSSPPASSAPPAPDDKNGDTPPPAASPSPSATDEGATGDGLAETGAGNPWAVAGISGTLLAAGAGATFIARRRGLL